MGLSPWFETRIQVIPNFTWTCELPSVYQNILGNSKMEQLGFKSSHSIPTQKLRFLYGFENIMIAFISWMILSSHSILEVVPHQGIFEGLPSLLIILLLKSLYGALGSDENFEAHLPCICCEVKSRTSLERSVILLDQNYASVWNLVEIYSLVWFDL